MAKVGVLTFHTAINYGAALQAFALVSTIRKLGNSVELIDYEGEALRLVHNARLRDSKSPKDVVKFLVTQAGLFRRKQKFDSFTTNIIGVSRQPIVSMSSELLAKKYEVVVVGSDQVWNTSITKGDDAYLLKELDPSIQKVAYAASFGATAIPSEETATFENAFSSFRRISVREKTGAQILERQFGLEVPVVVDPVFLFTREEWAEAVGITQHSDNRRPYILLYLVSPNSEAVALARQEAEVAQCELKVIHKQLWRRYQGFQTVRAAAPFEFLELLANAEKVVTNSFHGMAFSTIFGKEATVVLNENPGRNTRMEDLCDTIKEDGAVKISREGNRIEIDRSTPPVEVLSSHRAIAIQYLNEAIVNTHG